LSDGSDQKERHIPRSEAVVPMSSIKRKPARDTASYFIEFCDLERI